MTDKPRIVLVGATGKTGNAVALGLVDRSDVKLVACVAPSLATSTPSRAIPAGTTGYGSLAEVPSDMFDVVVDLSLGAHVIHHAQIALGAGAHLVIGATGVTEDELEAIGQQANERSLGVYYCPNFSIGAVLMMRLSSQIAGIWDGSIEIVETHHDEKIDSPSGTASHTASLIAAAGGHSTRGVSSADIGPARGMSHDGVRIHSIRLPGAVAHQDVRFGAPGEMLTISHDALDRTCYAAGVALASRAVRSRHGLTTGLEHIL